MAVVRLEWNQNQPPPAWMPDQRKAAAAMIVDIVRITRAPAIQIDFDAPGSARPFYRDLLAEVRRDLDPGVFLSITALVSWCTAPHGWLNGLPVDEVVPMAFDVGELSSVIANDNGTGDLFADRACRKSFGLAPGLPYWRELPELRAKPGQRIYIFDSGTFKDEAAIEGAFAAAMR